ncbi:MAG: serine/threonine protein kinase [Chloroflexi bacterium]|nr:serine/threonine protein kinase [Chloroflexota bacterium]
MEGEKDKETIPKDTILYDRYKIVKVLGAGSFGAVYQAIDLEDPKSETLVSVKEMPKPMIVDHERQADIRATLLHPAIPRIYAYFLIDDRSYLVQEFVHGNDLESIMLEIESFLPEGKVVSWAIEICDVLDYLHNHQLFPTIFRDVKPDNVVLDRRGHIHLIDFGVARVFPPGFFQVYIPDFVHFQQGLNMGTEGYAPPEQHEGIAMPQSDIYALGASMHHLLTKRDPREEEPFTFNEFPVRSLNPNVSADLEHILNKALEHDMDARFPSVSEMKTALMNLVKRT